jgi:predicted nucleic acid-binding protein
MNAVLDASVWVARLVRQDAFHDPVKRWMETRRAAGDLFYAPDLLLAEVSGAIRRRLDDQALASRAVEVLMNLPALRLVEMDRELLVQASRLAAELGLRGADATYAALAQRLNLPLATFDADQRERVALRIPVADIE